MLEIFVCEDDLQQKYEIDTIIENYLMMMDYDAKFTLSTTNPYDILDKISTEKTEGLYFLDIDLNSNINGIELGVEIRDLDPNAKIVYITSHAELTYLTFVYKVEAMDYMPKGARIDLKSRIIECIDVAMSRHLNSNNSDEEQIFIKCGESDIKLIVDDILFFESSTIPHKIVVHLDNRMLEFYGKIKDIEKINENFIRCHKSYIVNKKNIKKIDRQKRVAIMLNEEKCLISTRYMKDLINSWI